MLLVSTANHHSAFAGMSLLARVGQPAKHLLTINLHPQIAFLGGTLVHSYRIDASSVNGRADLL
jgi:hypothetical protein